MKYCDVEVSDGVATCRVCGSAYKSDSGRVRAICGIDRTKKPPPEGGVGSEVKKLLSRIGITASPTCQCAAKARQMDYMGVKWCEDNIDTIVGWLRDEARTRKLPYSDFAGKALLLYAIRRARKAGAREGLPEDMVLAH